MPDSEPDLKMHVQVWESIPRIKRGGKTLPVFEWFYDDTAT